jgi:rhamnogalacturonan endolyase
MNKTLFFLWIIAFSLTCPSASCKKKAKEKSAAEAPIGPNYNNLQLEKLGRGLVAIHQGKGYVAVSWRKLVEDSKKVSFDLYRKSHIPGVTKLKDVRLNDKPLKTTTYFVDKSVDTTITQEYILVESKSRKKAVSYLLTPERAAMPYLSIKLPPIDWDTTRAYMPNDASVGDLDGDGEYELVVKRQIGNFACSQAGISGGTNHLEAYKLDGKRLWQVDIGINVREGAQYFSFMVLISTETARLK